MKLNVKNIVKENLNTRYNSNQKFHEISLIENEEERFLSTVKYINELIEGGYDENKLKNVLNEQSEWLGRLFGGNERNPEASPSATAKNVLAGSGFSWFKEYAYKYVLNLLGFKGPMANAMATALSEMNITDFMGVFGGREKCMYYSPNVARALIEAMFRYIIETSTKQDSSGYNIMRNMSFQFAKEKGIDVKIGQAICNASYKAKGNLVKKAKENLPKQSPDNQKLPEQ